MQTVSLRHCGSYEYDAVKQQIDTMIADLGGLDKYIKPGSTVYVKLNLIMRKNPERMATTHPIVFKGVAQTLLDHGCKVVAGDSPGGPYTKAALTSVYNGTGIAEVANELGVQLNYDLTETQIHNPDATTLKNMTVTQPLLDADYIVNLCKLKTHSMATFTGGVKNLFGAIPGTEKAEYHFRYPEIVDFTNALVDICTYIKPTLTIMDGIVGMEGAGPTAGTPRAIGVLLGSASPYALDVVACRLINLPPEKVPTVQRCVERNILAKDFSDVVVVGDDLESKIVKDYKIPENGHTSFLRNWNVPKSLEISVNKLLAGKPVVDPSKCVKCGICKNVCPPQVIEMTENGPQVNYKKCQRCFCCHELCPKEAIDLKRLWIFKLIH